MIEREIETSDPPATGRPGMRTGTAKSAATDAMHDRIVETAKQLVRQFGYQKTTVADIAAELDMSPANVYRFFSSKAAICEDVARKLAADVREKMREAADDPSLGARERLRRLVLANHHEIVNRCIADKRTHAMVHAAVENNWSVVQEHQESIRQMIAEIISDGIDAGEFSVSDPEAASHCFQAALISACHPVIVEGRLRAGEDIQPTLDPLLDFALRGLGSREPSGG
ncbi:TetR family transcriptional regulator [Defluviimonas sp. WL0024]|uniref:TetR family transcriptional regulator n=2 Tax=Albidovulum TaxID=205889 RepID=A0ABT3JB73_9RHOB|nr:MULTISPECIES: TetR/AcrR family transcriptional regulator [Defluviimonas]MCU9850603.1 TetR family transcriptional regulator [Defluviimonas sp. WL0024]MCW3784690.1 TetR family transcriptional regulator [Defluviimonas salinarum]